MPSRSAQGAAVVLAFVFVAILHRHNDGLWYGDAPLHAANGLFWWDLLTTVPSDPIEYALRYYARYPVIKPAGYPPLFYLLEGAAFAVAGPSPQVAKALVALFAIVAGLYTMAWSRRWIHPSAGWAGAFLAFVPGIVVWTNAVMLNVPATALSVAALYHFRCWADTADTRQLAISAAFVTAVLLTHFAGASVVCICLGFAVLYRSQLRLDRRLVWIGAAGLVACVPLAAALLLGPVQAARNLPRIDWLTNTHAVGFYAAAIPQVLGLILTAAGAAGLALGLASRTWRSEAAVLVIWVAALLLAVLLLPARDGRYILSIAPAFTIAAALGIASAMRHLPPLGAGLRAGALAAALGGACWSAARVDVPRVTGYREAALFMRQHAPRDAVLFDGTYGAIFAFYVRALDPGFERRVVAGNKFLYEYGPTSTFRWVERSYVSSTDDVVQMLRTKSGCRWVVLSVPPAAAAARTHPPKGQQLLREAVGRPEFQLVQSFPTSGVGGRRIDVYRIDGDVDPVTTVDLRFSGFSGNAVRQVVPITR